MERKAQTGNGYGQIRSLCLLLAPTSGLLLPLRSGYWLPLYHFLFTLRTLFRLSSWNPIWAQENGSCSFLKLSHSLVCERAYTHKLRDPMGQSGQPEHWYPVVLSLGYHLRGCQGGVRRSNIGRVWQLWSWFLSSTFTFWDGTQVLLLHLWSSFYCMTGPLEAIFSAQILSTPPFQTWA